MEKKLQAAYAAVLAAMQRGPCGPASIMATRIAKQQESMGYVFWDGKSVADLHAIWTSYSLTDGIKGIPVCTFFPYSEEVEMFWRRGDAIKANDALYCQLVRTLEEFISLDKANYPAEKIHNPYHQDYYFEIGRRPTFLLCMSKTSDWIGRYIDSPHYACLIVQDHAMFPAKDAMDNLRPLIRTSEKNLVSCPFHKGKKIFAYPQEMPCAVEFSEMHITRLDDATGRRGDTHPDSRLFYKQLPGTGLYVSLQTDELEKITKEEFAKLIIR